MFRITKLLLTGILLVITACHHEWKNPNETVPSAELEITSILATPHVYDSAGVRVTGMVWDSEIVTPEPEVKEDGEVVQKDSYLQFKLSDKKGYYISIVAEQSQTVEDGDIVEVTGYFRRYYIPEKSNFKNEIHARKITVVESLSGKYEESAVR